MRGPFVILASLVSVIGYAMYRGSTDKHVRYGALFVSPAASRSGAASSCGGRVYEYTRAMEGSVEKGPAEVPLDEEEELSMGRVVSDGRI